MISYNYLEWENRSTPSYKSELKKDNYTTYYFEWYQNKLDHNISYWKPTLAAMAAGFITEVSFSLCFSSFSVFPIL